MAPEHPSEPRPKTDRRRNPTSPWSCFRTRGRRQALRRENERGEAYFVDLIDPSTFLLSVLLLILTIVDGVVTLILLRTGCSGCLWCSSATRSP
jgi:hypothetical protein